MNYPVTKIARKILLTLAITTMAGSAAAKINGIVRDTYTLDVFKTDVVTAEALDAKFSKEFELVASRMLDSNGRPNLGSDKSIDNALSKIMDEVKNSGDFAYVGMSPVKYPGNKKIGISIEVVEKKQITSIQGMLPKPTKSYPDPKGLIASWREYEDYGWKNIFMKNPRINLKECPAFHCLFGFADPATKKYAVIFNAEVPRHKTELINILRNDKDETKRGTAALLLAHLKSGNEIIDILAPSMRDASPGVRNNVIRVLMETVVKVKNVKFPVSEAIHALSYPTTTDRNKDLYLLASLSSIPKYKQYIKDHACHAVMDQYRLVQLNLHDGAYSVLKNISDKSYALDDISSWENWEVKNCPHPDKA